MRHTVPSWVLPALAAILLVAGGSAAAVRLQQGFDAQRLGESEELSEQLANRLLDFSVAVRDRDWEQMRSFFGPIFEQAPFPDLVKELASGRRIGPWISAANLTPDNDAAVPLPPETALAQWRRFLGSFESLEDARWKVAGASFQNDGAGVRADASFKFFLVGRDGAQRRLWVRGKGRLKARRSPDWRLDSLVPTEIELQRADIDLFSEVSLPAGVAVPLPRYGEPGNDDFVYHGAAAGDLDHDGFVDVVATGLNGVFLYRNLGDGRFEEIGWRAGLPPLSRTTAPLLVDYDNDGDQDLFLAAVGPQVLLENVSEPGGGLRFIDVSVEAGVGVAAHGFGAAAGDVNGDGLPDIYVSSYNRYGEVMPNSWHRATNGTPNLLLVNQGNGRFRDEARVRRVADSRWSYAAQLVDIDADGRLDLYVVNDFGENGLFLNRGERFEDASRASGLLDPGNGMGVSFGDYDNDGRLDVFVTNMSSTAGNRILQRLFGDSAGPDVLRKLAAGNMLYRGRADGSFENVTGKVGPFAGGWAWGGVLVDVDNDGWQDSYSASGFVSGKSMADT